MPIAHQAYLLLVVCGFLAFGISLASVSWWTNRAPRKAPGAQARSSSPASDTPQVHKRAA